MNRSLLRVVASTSRALSTSVKAKDVAIPLITKSAKKTGPRELQPRPPPTPHDISLRVKSLAAKGELPEAVELVRRLPLAALDVVVYGTLIAQAFKLERYALGFRLYNEMKKRGLRPASVTFLTIFSGLARVSDWDIHPKLRENVNATYEAYKNHISIIKERKSDAVELGARPINAYLVLLGNMKDWQRMWDVFYAMDKDGPLAPDEVTFSVMMRNITRARLEEGVQPGKESRAISEGRFLWLLLVKSSNRERNPLKIDDRAIPPILKLLSGGKPGDQEYALGIASDYLGLAIPGKAQKSPKVELEFFSFLSALQLCNEMGRYELCIDFFNQVARSPTLRHIVDAKHLNAALVAHSHLASSQILDRSSDSRTQLSVKALVALQWLINEDIAHPARRIRDRNDRAPPCEPPTLFSYNLVLLTATRCADWLTAVKVFRLMTGAQTEVMEDQGLQSRLAQKFAQIEGSKLTASRRSSERFVGPNSETLLHLVNTALATNDLAHMRQCVRMLDWIGPTRVLSPHEEKYSGPSGRYYRKSFAQALDRIVSRLLPERQTKEQAGQGFTPEEEKVRWTVLRFKARKALDQDRSKTLARQTAQIESQDTVRLVMQDFGEKSKAAWSEEDVD